ncbi:Esterase [Lysobacter dokdonensis DS-58]|uniref:Esterase n=1 Tax=Lysobacter dokdonensis DS-58 TaxID=1300345 RepID=A0A0A2WIQ5_9GAMM|nr:alpha/beta hydrolase [Lysobacter dokdonensis]KGQ18597.1 Esterase [Lysobacter dokdonensis DS-58]
MLRLFALAVALLMSMGAATAAEILTAPPAKPDPTKHYVIYLHGKIVEEKGAPRPVDDRFGVYDWPAVLESLALRGAVVISQQRPKDTAYIAFAGGVVGQIEALIAAGVPEDHIAVVGFSKGGAIAMRVSSFLRRPDVRFVLLAACWRDDEPQVRFTGRVLSIREKSDTLSPYSCKPIAEKAEKPTSFEEIVIDTGKSHGAFYLPRKQWTVPTLDFISGAATP